MADDSAPLLLFLSFVCRFRCVLFRLLFLFSVVCCHLDFIVISVPLSSVLTRARSLQPGARETVTCSGGNCGAGLLWSSCYFELLETSLAPPTFYRRI